MSKMLNSTERQKQQQYEQDIVYLAGGRPKWNGSLIDFFGDSIGFVINYIGESWRTPEQAREAVMKREKSLEDWIKYHRSFDQVNADSSI